MDKNKMIAEVEEYHLSSRKLKKGLKYVYMKGHKIITVFFVILLGVIFGGAYYYIKIEKYLNRRYYIAAAIGIIILYLLFSYIMFRLKIVMRAKKIMRSIPNNLLGLTVKIRLYIDRVEFDSDEAYGDIKYEDFYKIVKLDDGYLFLTTKKVFHYFEYSEIKTLYNLDYLDSILVKYYK